jgi:phosphonate metabolism-associated iron-containing alcohol dehydrogenase
VDSLFNPVKVFIGEDSLSVLPSLIKKRKYIVISSRGFNSRGWNNYFSKAECIIDSVSPNPTIRELSEHIQSIKDIECDTLVAIGGGSVIDVAKALSVLTEQSEERIINVLINGSTDLNKRFDVIAIPSTAGTGAEVTPFATIWDSKNKKKYSLSSSSLYPIAALVDPELALTLGLKETAYTGLDALSHCFESLWNKNATPFTKSIAFNAIDIILETLPSLFNELSNIKFRSRMSWASYMGGLCINHTKTAVAHSISYPLTSHLAIPHGLASGVFLPEILSFNKINDKTKTMDEIYDKLSNSKSLDQKLRDLYQSLNKRGLFKIILENKLIINSLVSEMINPARSLNNIVNISYKDIQSILDSFYQKN